MEKNWIKKLKIGFLALSMGFFVACNNKTSEESTTKDEKADKIAQSVANPDNSAQGANEQTTPTKEEDLPKFQFETTVYDFGEIKEGQIVKYIFKFKNVGKTPLVIQNATASCGCTVPEWTKEPIAPNAEGELRVEFNSAGKTGQQLKTVSINANTIPSVTELTIKGTVNAISNMNGPLKNPSK
ncbi:MAG: DUF1573 domain-containing protein [Microscillaceae bacterium]|jgi:hypothetical protein|nr:DUF1573 domain-containing protein [Microscillaceae bacterium]